MKKIKKLMPVLLSFVFVVSTFMTITVFAAEAEQNGLVATLTFDKSEYAANEDVTLEKVKDNVCTIKLGEDGEVIKKLLSVDNEKKEVTLQVDVKNIKSEDEAIKPTEMFLVIDDSKSMTDNTLASGKTRKEAVFTAAKTLADVILKEQPTTEIGVVSFSSNSDTTKEGALEDAKLVIAGKGGMIDELRAQANALGLGNKVYFAGYLGGKDVEKMYKAADISVFPSTYEPFGIVALEGMLAERPIVVSDAGGLGEIVEHRETGMKSYCGNPNSIADSILELLYNPELCANIVKKAKAKVKNNYTWAKIAQDTHFTYQKAICETMAERQRKQLEQEKAQKTKKAKGTEKEITNLLPFRKRQAYA